ncbi:MAG: UbiA family prenyltransferase [Opitutales bacterium]
MPPPQPDPPVHALCVDLDGTLVRSDATWESILAEIRARPVLGTLKVLRLALKGRSHLKAALRDHLPAIAEDLPLNPGAEAAIAEARRRGWQVILVTASDQAIADRLADRTGLFDAAYGSRPGLNLKGRRKAAFMDDTFGEKAYVYLGDAPADRAVWPHAAESWITGPHRFLARGEERRGATVRTFFEEARPPAWAIWAKGLRMHQWVKNLLVFVPLLAAHRWSETGPLVQSLLAFAGLSCIASSVYLINDLVDLPSDRRHPTKSQRMLAAGWLTIQQALLGIPLIFFLGIAFGAAAGLEVSLGLWAYGILVLGYIFFLKKLLFLDALSLAGFYVLRIAIGGLAAGVVLSPWLLGVSLFFFLSLAMAKRTAELNNRRKRESDRDRPGFGRAYQVDDLPLVAGCGVAAGYGSVIILALYISSPVSARLYPTNGLLWLLCPLVLYWISRVWLLTWRGHLDEDPIVFALRDRASWLVGVAGLLIFSAASFWGGGS